MRSASIAFVVVLLAGFGGILATGLTRDSALVYTPGVAPAAPLLPVAEGETACQGPMRVPGDGSFDRIAFTVGTYAKPGPAIRAEIVSASGVTLAIGSLPAGYPDVAREPEHVVRVGRVQTRGAVEVCLSNEGTRPVALYGQETIASPRTNATIDGVSTEADFAVELRREPQSLIALLPEVVERASLFRAGWVTPTFYVVLACLLVVGVPMLLARGLARAAAADCQQSDTGSDRATRHVSDSQVPGCGVRVER